MLFVGGLVAVVLFAACAEMDLPFPPGSSSTTSTTTPTGSILFPEIPTSLTWSEWGSYEHTLLSVPLDYTDPDQGSIELNVVRRVAPESPKRGSLFMVAGGPGQASSILVGHYKSELPETYNYFDIYAVDQRGTGENSPLMCSQYASLFDSSTEVNNSMLEQCLQELESSGMQLGYFSTESAVHDLEFVRQALELNKIHLLGVSYGTFFSLYYASIYPNSVASLVLDGVADGEYTHMEGLSTKVENAMQALLDACPGDSYCYSVCSNCEDKFNTLYQEVSTNGELELTGSSGTVSISQRMFSSTFLSLIQSTIYRLYLPLTIEILHENSNPSAVDDAVRFIQSVVAIPDSVSLNLLLHYAITCKEWIPFEDISESAQAALTDRLGVKFEYENYREVCSLLSVDDGLPYSGPHPFEIPASIKVLLMSGAKDPSTDAQGAERALDHCGDGVHIVHPKFYHNTIRYSCGGELIDTFIEQQSTSFNASCFTDPQIFYPYQTSFP